MSEEPETVEDWAAGVLNGVMLCLLGSAFPLLVAWQLTRQWGELRLDFDVYAIGQAGGLVSFSIFSFLFVKTGWRLIRSAGPRLWRRSSKP
jgi:hypothetical protein